MVFTQLVIRDVALGLDREHDGSANSGLSCLVVGLETTTLATLQTPMVRTCLWCQLSSAGVQLLQVLEWMLGWAASGI